MATVAVRRKSKVATPKDVRGVAGKMPEEFLRCRDLNHVWAQYRVKRVRGGYERSLYCRSCKTAKHQFISPRGEILAGHYTYNDGYQIKGLGRIQADSKAVLRLEALDRSLRSGEVEIDTDSLEENE